MGADRNFPRAMAMVGMAGAGKTLCAQHLHDQGYFTLRFGGVVVDEVQRRGLDVNPENERIVREELRLQHGMAAMAVLSLTPLQRALNSRSHIIIDGLYSFSEYKYLRENLGVPLALVAIVAPRHLRYARLALRPDRPLSRAQAEARDILEIENLEKGGPIAIADYTLLNQGAPKAVLAALDQLLERLQFSASST